MVAGGLWGAEIQRLAVSISINKLTRQGRDYCKGGKDGGRDKSEVFHSAVRVFSLKKFLVRYRAFQKKRPNVCLFNISGTNEQISKPFFSSEN